MTNSGDSSRSASKKSGKKGGQAQLKIQNERYANHQLRKRGQVQLTFQN
jgi:hypothetical protein